MRNQKAIGHVILVNLKKEKINMKKKYTVDEILDKKFAIMLDREDETKKIDVPLTQLPVNLKEGDIVELEFKENKVIFAEVDIKETRKEREKVRKLINKLKNKSTDLKGF